MAVVAFVVFSAALSHARRSGGVIAGDAATSDDIERIREKLGLDEPFWCASAPGPGPLLHGDLGISIFTNLPVTHLIGAARRADAVADALHADRLGRGGGAAGRHRRVRRPARWIDRLVMVFSVLGFSVPVFVLAYMLIFMFAIELDWLPVQGYRRIREGFWPWLQPPDPAERSRSAPSTSR